MRLLRIILALALSLAAQFAFAAAPQGNQPVSVLVGNTFSLKLQDGADCSTLKPAETISLLVNGMDAGLRPLGCDPATGELSFYLDKDALVPSPASSAAWQTMLGSPLDARNSDFRRELRYTVTQPRDPSGVQILSAGKMELRMLNRNTAIAGVFLTVALWVSLIVLGRRSGMLRDTGVPGGAGGERSFSLSRFQMAWWFGVVIGAYIFLWMMTGEIPELNSHSLALMGLSGVTSLVAVSLDANKGTAPPPSSGSFLKDLLTDANGITLHRFQMLAMTVILGIMFIYHVTTHLAMPDLDTAQLAIMGMAGGTYLGFKVPEKQEAGSDTGEMESPAVGVEEHKAGYTPGDA